jgi:hypothetical protein
MLDRKSEHEVALGSTLKALALRFSVDGYQSIEI